MSTSDKPDVLSPINHIIKLNKLKCEIKLVNNWKKLQLRSRFLFSEIDPIEIKAMMVAYYSIHCPLETKLEFSQFTQKFGDLPTIQNIVSFLKNQSTFKIIEDDDHNHHNNHILLSIQIELPLIVLPITGNNEKYHFYAFANGKLLLYHNNTQINCSNNVLRIGHKNKIFYADILSTFTQYNDDNHTFAHPKNSNFELNLLNECNICELNELNLEIMGKPTIANDHNRCVICLSHIMYEYEEYCRISCCRHIYHFECIENLIKYSNDNQCPLCREKIKYVQYCSSNTAHLSINKIFKIKNQSLCMISHKHHFNKFYKPKKKQSRTYAEEDYDEKEDGIIRTGIPSKPCLGYLESMPSPTNSNSSISIPPQRNSSPSSPDMDQLTLNNNNNNNNNSNHDENAQNDQTQSNNNNGNNNNNNGNTSKSLGYFDSHFYDKNAGEDD